MIQGRQIEAFRAVMLRGTMTSAAGAIHVTQPAISRLIRDFEAEVGMRLFERRGKQLLPTAEAQALFIEVERAFIGLDRIQSVADDIRAGRASTLRLAVLPAMASGYAPRFVAKFCNERPNLKVIIDGISSPQVRERVLSGEYDVGISAFPFVNNSFSVIPLNDAAVAVLPVGHRLATRPVIEMSDLGEERLIVLSKTPQHPLSIALQSGTFRQVVETSLATIACTLAAEGMGIAVVDPFSASEFVGRNVVMRRIEPAFTIGAAVIYALDRRLSLPAREFMDEFLAHTRSFLEQNNCVLDGNREGSRTSAN
jgi:DNA-binding transcriptional LysR family regulator